MKISFPVVRVMKGLMLNYMPGMITCAEADKFIDDYIDQSLSPSELAIFERHLKLCRECRDYLIAYQKSIEAGKTALSVDPTDVPTLNDMPSDLIAAITAAKAQHSPK